MTETEARQFITSVRKLCIDYEQKCNCRIDIHIKEEYHGRKLKWLVVDKIMLKVD